MTKPFLVIFFCITWCTISPLCPVDDLLNTKNTSSQNIPLGSLPRAGRLVENAEYSGRIKSLPHLLVHWLLSTCALAVMRNYGKCIFMLFKEIHHGMDQSVSGCRIGGLGVCHRSRNELCVRAASLHRDRETHGCASTGTLCISGTYSVGSGSGLGGHGVCMWLWR